MLQTDAFIDVLIYVDAASWISLSRSCREFNALCMRSAEYVLVSWKSDWKYPFNLNLHEMLQDKRLYELYVILSRESTAYHPCVDESHKSLLDLAVDLRMYNMGEWLVCSGFKSFVDAETMFDCIRRHDIRGASILLSCGIPVDRFRSRDDGLNVLTCSVLYGTPALVDMFLLNGVSVPDGILIQAILARHSDIAVMDMVFLLVDKGRSDVNSTSITGVPALHVAISHSPFALQLVELFASRGADVNSTDGADGGGYTPLDLAARKRKRNCYEALVKYGAVHSLLYGIESGDISVIHSYLRKDIEGVPQKSLEYLLCFASALGQTESVKAILASGCIADINKVFVRNDISPLHLAACRGHSSVCKQLIKLGINVSAKADGGMDIHMLASNITGTALWTFLPPPIRKKTAAELAREAGFDEIGRDLDLYMVETVIARNESFDSASSGSNSTMPSRLFTLLDHSPPQGDINIQGLENSNP